MAAVSVCAGRCMARHDKASQDKASQDKAGQDKTR